MFKQHIINLLKKEVKQDIILEIPKEEFGDYAFPCFSLAKKYKKNPNEIASELATKIKSDLFDVSIAGPYLNFTIKREKFANHTINKILKEKDKYGRINLGKNKKAIIEHTSINPNASPHVGRARNAVIGDSLTRLLKFVNYKTQTNYFVNDVGKQIALLVLASKNKKVNFDKLLNLYININKKLKQNKKVEQEAFSLLHKLEKNDKKTKLLFKKIVDICIKGQIKILKELDIKYDQLDYESRYLWNKSLNLILAKLEKSKKLFTDKDGRKVLDQSGYNLAMRNAVLVLTRSDGTSLYPLRDIAYTIDKLKLSDKNLLILGEDQKLYFQQIKVALSMLGYKAPEVIHYSHILLRTGRMSTREGNLVLLSDFMKELEKKAQNELKKRYKKVNKKLAKTIAYGALKYSIIKVHPDKNVIFDLQQALSFEGDTGPYIQYAYARANSILKKARLTKVKNFSLLTQGEETRLIKKLNQFPEIIQELKPYLIANYAFDLAKLFSEFYHNCPVLSSDKKLRDARLNLVFCVKQVLKNSLNLLGIEAPLRM